MYAVIQTGGKQYRVQTGQIIEIEKLEGDVGTAVKFDQVLFSSNANAEAPKVTIGKPLLSGALVTGEIVGQGRGEKSIIVKMKRRKQYRRTQGHRQYLTQVLVTAVDNGAGEKANLSAEDKKTTLSTFHTHLTPKGEAFSPKILGSRKRMAAAANALAGHSTPAGSKTPSKKTAAGAAPASKAKAPAKKKTTK
jgi:large subunit ribosomal protein L21